MSSNARVLHLLQRRCLDVTVLPLEAPRLLLDEHNNSDPHRNQHGTSSSRCFLDWSTRSTRNRRSGHRTKAGKYDPFERLAAVRDTLFPVPGVTLGKPKLVFSQSWFPWWREFVENASWTESGVLFTTLHVVGSNNDLVPWFTDDAVDPLVDDAARRTAEFARRDAANRDWLTLRANEQGARGARVEARRARRRRLSSTSARVGADCSPAVLGRWLSAISRACPCVAAAAKTSRSC